MTACTAAKRRGSRPFVCHRVDPDPRGQPRRLADASASPRSGSCGDADMLANELRTGKLSQNRVTVTRITAMGTKCEYRSRIVVEGLDRAPHRAFLRACGLDDDDLDKPRIGIVSTQGENTPCSMSLAPQADAARIGVAAGGGMPVPFTTISVSHGISMNHKGMRLSLVSREIIADSIEAVMRGHAYDALIGFAGCDETLPGIMMAMVRLNAPSVFVYGGAMLPGRWRGRDVTVLPGYEGVGSVLAGNMSEAELRDLERVCAPTVGSCPGQFTANTMAMVSETLGLALPGSAMLPAVYSERLALARRAGKRGAAESARR